MCKTISTAVLVAVFILSGASTGMGFGLSEIEREFYLTRLYAIKTQITLLKRQGNHAAAAQKEALLAREKVLLEKRIRTPGRALSAPKTTTKKRGGLTRDDIKRIAEHKARKYGVPPNLIKAVIRAESGYNINARSHKGAMGLMQLMPETAKDLGVRDPWDPHQNIEGGTKYLALLLREFKGNVRHALIGYNSGPSRVRKKKSVFRETKVYVKRVIAYMQEA